MQGSHYTRVGWLGLGLISAFIWFQLSTLGSAAAEVIQPVTVTTSIVITAPILMYHHIGNPVAGRFNVATDQFAAQMRWLAKEGYTSVSIDQIAIALLDGQPLPPKSIAITFDDGWKNQIRNAVPILNQYGLKATFYIVGTWISKTASQMSWDDVRVLRDQGHWIGSHSYSHKIETTLSDIALAIEITGGRELIYGNTGVYATTFAYPSGAVNARVENIVVGSGYTAAVWVVADLRQRSSSIYRLKRTEIRSTYSLNTFIGWVTGVRIVPAKMQTVKPTPTKWIRRN